MDTKFEHLTTEEIDTLLACETLFDDVTSLEILPIVQKDNEKITGYLVLGKKNKKRVGLIDDKSNKPFYFKDKSDASRIVKHMKDIQKV